MFLGIDCAGRKERRRERSTLARLVRFVKLRRGAITQRRPVTA
jgi:hypothetical protein